MGKFIRFIQRGVNTVLPSRAKYGDDAVARDGTFYTIDENKNLVEMAKVKDLQSRTTGINITGTPTNIDNFTFANGYMFGIWYSTTDGGTSNVTTKPESYAFRLTLTTQRAASATDYRQTQIWESQASFRNYIRFCTNGVWTDWLLISTSGRANNAISAEALTTSRKINNIDFNGSSDIIVPVQNYYVDRPTTDATNVWWKFATRTLTTVNDDTNITLLIKYGMSTSAVESAIVNINFRTPGAVNSAAGVNAKYLSISSGFNSDTVGVKSTFTATNWTHEIWVKSLAQYQILNIVVLSVGSRTGHGQLFTLAGGTVNSPVPANIIYPITEQITAWTPPAGAVTIS